MSKNRNQTLHDNYVQTFQLESSNLRGRIVKFGNVLQEIIAAHHYPLAVSHMVAETLTLTGALSSMLKYQGIFTIQAQGDGAVKMVVSDVTSEGIIRACASFDEERLERAAQQIAGMETKEGSRNHLAQYLGKGYLAFTVDQGNSSERYQGIVEIKGASLTDCVQHYFRQSEQIGTGIKMAAGQRGGQWRSGALMLQHLPEDQKNPAQGIGNVDEDDWRRAMILQDTCTEQELLDPALDTDELIFRLFHEEGVRVYERHPLFKGCRCDEDRVINILASLGQDDLEYIAVDGRIVMTCEFCSKNYDFSVPEMQKKIEKVRQ